MTGSLAATGAGVIEVRPGKAGRGVFALRAIRAGSLIEVAPVLPLADGEIDPAGILASYVYRWSSSPEARFAVAFGCGSLYNHAHEANADFTLDYSGLSIAFYARRDIRQDEEICINYDYDQADLDANPHLGWYTLPA